MTDSGFGMVIGFLLGCLLVFVLFIAVIAPMSERVGYRQCIEDIKSYGAEKVVARFDKDHGK